MNIYDSNLYIMNDYEDRILKLYKIEYVDSLSHALRYCFEEVAFYALLDGKFRWIEEDVEEAKDFEEFLVYPLEMTLKEEIEDCDFKIVKRENYFFHKKPEGWEGE